MHKTRIMSGAFLLYKNEIIFMHRNTDRKIAPGVWAPIGGHIEPHEIKNPIVGCLREIEEEAGIKAQDITDLTLKYITVRNFDNEIRTVFTFIGNVTKKSDLPKSDEGVLHWIDYKKLPDLPMMFSMKQTVLHWCKNKNSSNLFLGTVNSANDHITWNTL